MNNKKIISLFLFGFIVCIISLPVVYCQDFSIGPGWIFPSGNNPTPTPTSTPNITVTPQPSTEPTQTAPPQPTTTITVTPTPKTTPTVSPTIPEMSTIGIVALLIITLIATLTYHITTKRRKQK